MNDLLCFRAHDNIYGIPLEYVKQSFVDQKITQVPRLNHYFDGLCNHKGIVYPVLSFSKLLQKENHNHYTCMLLLSINKSQLILRIHDVPSIVYKTDIINDSLYDGGTDIMKLNHICQTNEDSIYVLDINRILDILSENIWE